MRQGENSLFYFLFLGIIPPSEPFVNRFSKNIFYVWQKLPPLVSTDARGLFCVVLAGVFALPAIVFAQISSKTGSKNPCQALACTNTPTAQPAVGCPAAKPRGSPGGTPGRRNVCARAKRDVRDREQANLRFRLAEICFLSPFLCGTTKKGHP